MKKYISFGIFILFNIMLFSVEVNDIKNKLNKNDCLKYSIEKKDKGLLAWVESVDKVKKCDSKTINFLSSYPIISVKKTDLALLSLEYEYCDGVELLSKAFSERMSKLKKMKSNLNKCLNVEKKSKVNFLKKMESLVNKYKENKKELLSLEKMKIKIKKVISLEKKSLNGDNKKLLEALKDEILLSEKIKKVEKRIKDFEQMINKS